MANHASFPQILRNFHQVETKLSLRNGETQLEERRKVKVCEK